MSNANFEDVVGGSSHSARRSPRIARKARPAPFPPVDSLEVSKRMHEAQERIDSTVKVVKTGLEKFFRPRKGK